MTADTCFLQTQVTVPCKGHENVAGKQQKDRLKGWH